VVDQSHPKEKGVSFIERDTSERILPHELLEKPRVVINLAGRPISARWTQTVRQEIYDSRIESTKNIVALFDDLNYRPEVFISASAVGYYGDCGEEPWEARAREAERYSTRVVLMRQGTILGKDGGYLKAVLKALRFGIVPAIGEDNEWFPWIHVSDAAQAYHFVAQNPLIRGPVNVAAPVSLTRGDFTRTLSRVYGAKRVIRLPDWALKTLLGFERELSWGQKVLPAVLERSGFSWEYPKLSDALKAERLFS
jgi:uncharacterized protein